MYLTSLARHVTVNDLRKIIAAGRAGLTVNSLIFPVIFTVS
jgi:hypothetical protein